MKSNGSELTQDFYRDQTLWWRRVLIVEITKTTRIKEKVINTVALCYALDLKFIDCNVVTIMETFFNIHMDINTDFMRDYIQEINLEQMKLVIEDIVMSWINAIKKWELKRKKVVKKGNNICFKELRKTSSFGGSDA